MKNSPQDLPRTGTRTHVPGRASPPSSLRSIPPATVGTIGGQVLAAAGIMVQWLAEPALFPGFPPGLIYIGAAAVIVWWDRRTPWSPLAAVLLSLWITVGGLVGGQLAANLGSANSALAAGNAVMLLGLVSSSVAAVFAIRHNRRQGTGPLVKPLSARNPRRTAVWCAVAGMLADAIGDAAPEGLRWDGPGPAMFAALALLVALVPGRFMPMLSVALSAAFIVGLTSNPESLAALTDPGGDPVGFGGVALQLAGLITTVVAGSLAAFPRTRRSAWGRTP
ncbi:hypothetical protein [Streptomyces sp. Ac-502]|uniref:hypothetical protein n=1 Tax=Streptomyces sp. Ac-502 TaxID=3342801 RepID=UPI003862893A